MKKDIYRKIQSVLLFVTLVVLSYSFYFEYVKGMEPCPLCLMQRFSAFLFGLLCLLGLFISTLNKIRWVAFFQIFFSAAGLFFSTRQMWLQSLPIDEMGVCMPGLDMMMRYFPLNSVLKALFWGTSDCGAVTWKFIGLSMAEWSGIYFLILFIISCIVFSLIFSALKNNSISTDFKRLDSK